MLPTACNPVKRGSTSNMFGPITAPNINSPNSPGSRSRSATSGPNTITRPTTVKPNAGLNCTAAQSIGRLYEPEPSHRVRYRSRAAGGRDRR